MVVGLIIRLVLYGVALFFGAAGLIFATGSQYGMGTRIGAIGMIFGALAILPVTRNLILNKYGISVGVILAITIFLVTFIGFGTLSATAGEVEIGDIQTNISENELETQATLTNPQSQKVPVNINTTLVIQPVNDTQLEIWQRTSPSVESNTTEKYAVLHISRTNHNNSQVDIEFRDPNGTAVGETTINESHWSAIQNGNYSIRVNISNGANTTHTPTSTRENIIGWVKNSHNPT